MMRLWIFPLMMWLWSNTALLAGKEIFYGALITDNGASFAPWAWLCDGAFLAVIEGRWCGAMLISWDGAVGESC